MRTRLLIAGVVLGTTVAAQQAPNPRQQPGAMVHIFAPEQHDLYDGHFVISGPEPLPSSDATSASLPLRIPSDHHSRNSNP